MTERARASAVPGTKLRRLVLATTNRGKLADFRLLFAGTGVELVSPTDLGMAMDVEETGATFADNALLKARALAHATGCATLADDSGIVAYALGDEPGVYSARYAGSQCDDHANNLKLIERLRGVEDRRAAFVCALALVIPGVAGVVGTAGEAREAGEAGERGEVGEAIVAEGRCEGRVIDEERGTNGFGYDAVFFRDDLGRTFGEATPEEKNARSHRGAAARALIAMLREHGLIGER